MQLDFNEHWPGIASVNVEQELRLINLFSYTEIQCGVEVELNVH